MAVEPLTRRQFLDLSWKTALGLVLAGCAPTPVAPTSAPVTPQNQKQPILDFTRPLSGSTTVESLLPQHWYISTETGFRLMDQNLSKAAPPLVNQPKTAYVSPEAYFHDAPINLGTGKKYKVGDNLPDGQYRYIPLMALQSIAISPGQLIQAEGTTAAWTNVYEATANGLLLRGIMVRTGLIGALAYASISGALQREIEGPRLIRWLDVQGNMRTIDLDDPALARDSQKIQINQATSNTADNALPKFQVEIQGSGYIPPDGWKPPDKNHCGEDMVDYFARLLVSSVNAMAFVEQLDIKNPSTDPKLRTAVYDRATKIPLLEKADENEQHIHEIDERLREKGCFFYSDGGSVFMDYKLMRERAQLKLGNYSKPDIRKSEYEQIWNKDESIHQSYRRGVTVLDGKFKGPDGKYNVNMTSDQALQIARQIIEQLWW